MNRITIPALLLGVVMIAGAFAFMPVQEASTVHLSGTITTTSDTDIDNILLDTVEIGDFTTTAAAEIGDFSAVQGSTSNALAIQAVETQIAALVQTGTSTEAVGGGINTVGVTVAANGIAFVTVTTTTDGTSGVSVELDGAEICPGDTTILVADSPFTCAFAVLASEVIVVEANTDDSAAIGVITIISTAPDAT